VTDQTADTDSDENPVAPFLDTSAEQYTVYLAGAVRHADDSGRGWRAVVERIATFQTANPLDKYDPSDDQMPTAEQIVEADLDMINASDAVLVYDDGTPVHGTPMEQHYAYNSAMPVAVAHVADEQLSPWTQYHADYLRGTLRGGVAALELHLRRFGTTIEPNVDASDEPAVISQTPDVTTYDPTEDIAVLDDD